MQIILRDIIESDLPILYEQQLDPEAIAIEVFPLWARTKLVSRY